MSAKHYKIIRNITIIAGMVISFVIWLYIPETFKNSSFFHVGNGEYGSKWGALIILPLPLFSLCFRKEKKELYSDDQEYTSQEKTEAEKKNMQLGMITAIGLSLLIIAIMGVALILTH